MYLWSLFAPLFVIVTIKVTVLTHSLGIYHLVLVWALGSQAASTIQVVAMVAHTFCIMLHLSVRAPSHCFFGPRFPLRLIRGLCLNHPFTLMWHRHTNIVSPDLLGLEDWLDCAFGLLLKVQVF